MSLSSYNGCEISLMCWKTCIYYWLFLTLSETPQISCHLQYHAHTVISLLIIFFSPKVSDFKFLEFQGNCVTISLIHWRLIKRSVETTYLETNIFSRSCRPELAVGWSIWVWHRHRNIVKSRNSLYSGMCFTVIRFLEL